MLIGCGACSDQQTPTVTDSIHQPFPPEFPFLKRYLFYIRYIEDTISVLCYKTYCPILFVGINLSIFVGQIV